MTKRFYVVRIVLLGWLSWNAAQMAQAAGVLYANPGWYHAFDGNGDYYHDPDGPNPDYFADPDPSCSQPGGCNQPGGQANMPALIDPGPCGGAGQPSCEDAAIWSTTGSQWDGSAPGDRRLAGPPDDYFPPNAPPAPGGVGALMDGSTSFIRIQDTGVPQDWGWADKGAHATDNSARQEGNNRRIQFKHEMKDDPAFSDRLDIMDFGVTISFRTRIATAATGPLDDIYPEGGGEAPAPWPEDGVGYDVGNNGRGPFFVTQTSPITGANQLAFGLLDNNTRNQYSSGNQVPAKSGLVMNNRWSSTQDVNTNGATAATMNIVEIPNDELDEWHEFWITIQRQLDGQGNTHVVNVYTDGSLVPQTFNVIMGPENEFGAGSGSHLGMGLSSGSRLGAYDVDFYAYKEGVFVPTLAGLPGNHNKDQIVDAADYVAWRKLPSFFEGDPTGYNNWRENFGESQLGAGGSPVPEPSSTLLMVLMILAAGVGPYWRVIRR